MLIPRHWAKATGSADDPAGKRFALRIWGWSDRDIAGAATLARRRLSEAVARVARGGVSDQAYFYGRAPLREEIIRTVASPDTAMVTRNRYGALVLNTARVPFIDVDLPEGGNGGGGFLKSLFGGRKAGVGEATLNKVREACARHSKTTFRIYRTAAGFRVLATDLLIRPESQQALDLLNDFGADPFFAKLCKLQSSFRARLTPKPWRIDCPLPPGGHPRTDPEAERKFAEWLGGYEEKSRGRAVCEFVESRGPGRVIEEVAPILDDHDAACGAKTGLPLA